MLTNCLIKAPLEVFNAKYEIVRFGISLEFITIIY